MTNPQEAKPTSESTNAKPTSVMPKLKPCPFCFESEGFLDCNLDEDRREIYTITCQNCGAKGPWATFSENLATLKDVQKYTAMEWNQRGLKNEHGGLLNPDPDGDLN